MQIVALSLLLIGGMMSSQLEWKTGLRVIAWGLTGTTFLGLATYLAFYSIDSLEPEYVWNVYLFLICCTLAAVFLAILTYGIGFLIGKPLKSRFTGKHFPQIHRSHDKVTNDIRESQSLTLKEFGVIFTTIGAIGLLLCIPILILTLTDQVVASDIFWFLVIVSPLSLLLLAVGISLPSIGKAYSKEPTDHPAKEPTDSIQSKPPLM